MRRDHGGENKDGGGDTPISDGAINHDTLPYLTWNAVSVEADVRRKKITMEKFTERGARYVPKSAHGFAATDVRTRQDSSTRQPPFALVDCLIYPKVLTMCCNLLWFGCVCRCACTRP